MAESHDIEYRRMVSNIARELNAADVEQIAYVRLTGREDTTKYSAANPSASALDLLKSLERWGNFSVNNINPLKDVVKDARRNDLVEKINHFMIEESTKSKYLEELNFTKNRPRNKGRQNDDTSPAEELAGRFQDPGHRVFIVDRRKAPQILQRSDIVQELKTRTRETSQDNGGLTSAPTAGGRRVEKRKPLLPPKHKKTRQITTTESQTVKQQQQRVLSAQHSSEKPPSFKPSPAVSDPKHVYMPVMKSSENTDSTYTPLVQRRQTAGDDAL
jgi:hypothetical protein